MNRTATSAHRGGFIRAWLAWGAMASVSFSTGGAAARDKGNETAPAPLPPPPPPASPQQTAQPSESEATGPRAVVEARSARPRVITDWQEGDPIPPGYRPAQRMRKGPVIAGAVTFGVLYFINLLIAAASQDVANANHTRNDVAGLFVPVVGPFITMTQTSLATADIFLVLDAAGQATGAALLIYGLTSPQTVLVRDNVGRPALVPHPMVFASGGAGMGLSATF